MEYKRINGSIQEVRERERMAAENEKNKCTMEYVAMMAGIDLPEEEGQENE